MRKFFQRTAAALALTVSVVFSAVFYFNSAVPDTFYLTEGNSLNFENLQMLKSAGLHQYEETSLASLQTGANQTVNLKLFGVIPVKETRVKIVEEQEVIPGGTPFGIKLFTKGVVVIDVSAIETDAGVKRPAHSAGIQKGDVILSVGGREISSNEEIAAVIEKSGGNPVDISLEREGVLMSCTLLPVKSVSDGRFKGGIWVRDSSAGIGTITYYDEETGYFAGLGHAICDADTGQVMPLNTGDVCNVKINSVKKGQAGTPGELRGAFTSNRSAGNLLLNNETGIFGTLLSRPNSLDSVPVAMKQEIQTGPATILCTLDDNRISEYSIQIEKIDLNPKTQTKNMVLRVTDETLLQKTGGIVQGMSGSPILQNGKLVGAVTHVFINDPSKGYGIFAENMLDFSNQLLLEK